MAREQRPQLPRNHIRFQFVGPRATAHLPAGVKRLLGGVPDQVYKVELTQEGVLFRAVELPDTEALPSWVTSQTEDT